MNKNILKKQKEKYMKITKENKGITLIALVVTIVVLLILAGVSINLVVGDNGIINRAQEARDKHKIGANKEQDDMKKLEDIIEDAVPSPISKDTSFVGYYADLNGDGKITEEADGIIYVDIANEKKNFSGEWENYGNGKYDYTLTKNVKDYYKSTEKFNGKFGNMEWIAVDKQSKGKERFYVMALKDFSVQIDGVEKTEFTWYEKAMWKVSPTWTDIESKTNIGTGKRNSIDMLVKKGIYEFVAGDLWKEVKGKVEEEKWFVPSRAEWSAFAGELKIDKKNYSTSYNLQTYYLSSSVYDTSAAWAACFNLGIMSGVNVTTSGACAVRLSKTF